MNSKFHDIQQFIKTFPGIGEKQAVRITYFLMRQKRSALVHFSQKLIEIRDSVVICPESCHMFSHVFSHVFSLDNQLQNQTLSPFLLDSRRDKSKILVLEKQSDIDQFEALEWNGIYYIIDTLFSLKHQEKDSEKKIHFLETLKKWHTQTPLFEIIFACSLTVESEFTQFSLVSFIKSFCQTNDIKITHLARGLSSGSEISYMDSDTLKNALEHRLI